MRHPVALVAALVLACAGSRPAGRGSPLVGRRADVVAVDLGGAEVRVADDLGAVRVVDFWATWCAPCREQLPALDRLAHAYGARGVSVYAVSFDEDRAQLEQYLQLLPVSFRVLWDKGGARLSEPLAITRLPTTLVLDRRGVVRFVHLGYGADAAARLEDEVSQLLREDP